jgi:hypothetical protein
VISVPTAVVVGTGAMVIGAAYYAMLPPEQKQAMANDVRRFWNWLWNENTEEEGGSCEVDRDKIEETIQGFEDYIGDGKVIRNDNGDLVIVSSDGQRRVRIDLRNPHPHQNPHGHVEEKVNGQWDKSGPIYPKDVPHY